MERQVSAVTQNSGRRCLVVRLGHVYGPGLHWSSEIIMRHLGSGFLLPTPGESTSNAVHISSVSAALLRVLRSGPATGVFDLVQNPQWTWREVFDWHATALDLRPVPDADEAVVLRQAEQLRRRYAPISKQLAYRIRAAFGSSRPPSDNLLRVAKRAIRRSFLALNLDALEECLEEWLVNRNGKTPAPPQFPATGPAPGCEEWLFGQPSPGPALECPYVPGEEDQMELLQWYASSPAFRREAQWEKPEAES